MADPTNIVINQSVVGGVKQVKLVGKMDEVAKYDVIDLSQATAVEIDFEAVSLINSKGIQVWKEFMRTAPATVKVTYVRCPLRVVNQLNLFPSFNGGKPVRIASFFAPYFCEGCDDSVGILLDPDKDFPGGKVDSPPSKSCPRCQKPMEFDGNAQKYFLFLKRAS